MIALTLESCTSPGCMHHPRHYWNSRGFTASSWRDRDDAFSIPHILCLSEASSGQVLIGIPAIQYTALTRGQSCGQSWWWWIRLHPCQVLFLWLYGQQALFINIVHRKGYSMSQRFTIASRSLRVCCLVCYLKLQRECLCSLWWQIQAAAKRFCLRPLQVWLPPTASQLSTAGPAVLFVACVDCDVDILHLQSSWRSSYKAVA